MVDRSRALGAYTAVVTLGLAWFALSAAERPVAKFGEIDVERINVRERDGTLRMTISGADRFPGLIVAGREYPHRRDNAGMIFFNDEGTENGGLVFDGKMAGGKATNSGHLSFDRWRQDQTLYLSSIEDGSRRTAGLYVQDRPDRPLDVAAAARVKAMPDGAAKQAAMRAAGFIDAPQRVFVGRNAADASQLVLRDGAGRERLVLEVAKDGAAEVRFLDAGGRTVRTVRP
jgi:hypothetical protein